MPRTVWRIADEKADPPVDLTVTIETDDEELLRRVEEAARANGVMIVRRRLRPGQVLGECQHGVDLDREFCPHGCRV